MTTLRCILLGPIAVFALSCGGETDGVDDSPVDAVAWIADNLRVELRGIKVRSHASVSFRHAVGGYMWSPDRKRVLLESNEGLVVASTKGERHLLPSGVKYYDTEWSPNGRRLAFVQDGHPFIGDANGANGVPVPTDVRATALIQRITWSPDGSKVAFVLTPTIVVADVDATQAWAIATPIVEYAEVWWSPNGERLFYLSAAGSAEIVGADGGASVSVPLQGALGGWLGGWSADEQWLAIGGCAGALAILSSNGSLAQQFDAGCAFAGWSPAGGADFAFTQRLAEGSPIQRLQVWSSRDMTTRALVEADMWHAYSWSPDGSVILYSSPDAWVLTDSTDGSELARFTGRVEWNAGGSHFFTLAPASAGDSSTDAGKLMTATARGENLATIATEVSAATWLADGQHLAFGARGEVFTIRVDGSDRTKVFDVPSDVGAFGWLIPGSH